MRAAPPMPAQFTKPFNWPYFSKAWSRAACAELAEVISHTTASACSPNSAAFALTASLTSISTKLAPCCQKQSAVAPPRADAPPVITKVLSCNCIDRHIFVCLRHLGSIFLTQNNALYFSARCFRQAINKLYLTRESMGCQAHLYMIL